MSLAANNLLPSQPALSMQTARSAYAAMTRLKSKVMVGVCIGFTLVILTLLALVIGYLVSIGFKSLSWSFFTQSPIPSGMAGHPGGMHEAVLGTCILIAMASVVGIPIGMLTGIFLSEYSTGSRLTTPARFVADVLNGVPSIVVGILGYQLVVVPMGHYNAYAGALALAFIMIPIVARTTEEMLLLVPRSYREASVALGATKARTILRVVVPAATGSLITGIMLAIARVAGETAPLLFTALGSTMLDPRQPFPALTIEIFKKANDPDPSVRSLAWAGILVLILLIFVLNVMVRIFIRSVSRR